MSRLSNDAKRRSRKIWGFEAFFTRITGKVSRSVTAPDHTVDKKRNAANAGVISAGASRVAVRVIRADEALMIARSVTPLLGLGIPKAS